MKIAGSFTGPVTKWIVLAFWLAVVPFAGYFGGQLVDEQNNETESWLPDTAESTVALDRLTEVNPGSQNQIPTEVVYDGGEGVSDADLLAAAESDVAELRTLDGVVADDPETFTAGVSRPEPSADGEVVRTTITFDLGSEGWEAMPETADRIRAIADHDDITVYVAGAGGQAADSASAFEGLDSNLLLAALGVVVVLLLLAYRSPVLWLLPVITALVALTSAQALVYFLVKTVDLTVNGQTYGILSVLVIGASVDYALLLVARYREELRRHADRHEAMAFALHRASPAIIASGLTVALGMLCLIVADMNSTAGIGPVAAVGVTVGVLAMLTLLPALLVITGRWVFWPLRPKLGSHEPTSDGFWAHVAGWISRAPRLVWVTTVVLLALACLAWLRVDTSGLSTEESYTEEFDSVVGQQVLAEHGLVDSSNPAQVVADAEEAAAVRDAMRDIPGLAAPGEPLIIPSADPGAPGTAIIEAPMTDDPTTQAAFDTVERLRDAVHAVPDADAQVTGTAALFLDITDASTRDNWVIMPLVLLVVLLVLIGLLRSLLAPVMLIGTVVLSFGAAFGLSWLAFEFLFDHGGMNAGTPLFVFVFLVALGIDYNIFLMTRVREETPTRGTRQAARVALAATGGVITSAGLVLAGTFTVLTTMPLVDFVQIGFAIALGIILDTFIVRSVLVTALNIDLGGVIWWPSRLDRDRVRTERSQRESEPVA